MCTLGRAVQNINELGQPNQREFHITCPECERESKEAIC